MLLPLLVIVTVFNLLDAFDVSSCGIDKGCLLQPPNCDPESSASCQKAFSYQADGDHLVMELMGKVDSPDASYVAVAFSTDKVMGNDSVTECSISPNELLKGRLSYNLQKENLRVRAPQNTLDDLLTTVNAEYRDGRIFCVLRQKILPPAEIPPEQVRPLYGSYYVFLSTGPTSNLVQSGAQPFSVGGVNNIQPFNVIGGQSGTTNAWNLNNVGHGYSMDAPLSEGRVYDPPLDVTSSRLFKAHGIMMCIAWMVFLSTGMMFARYMRDHWPNSRMCGLMLWFHLHRTLNMIGIALTIASFACIFTAMDWRWRGPAAYRNSLQNRQWGSVHAMLGLLACLFVWIQPLNAVFRCRPGSRFRFIYNMIHRCIGFFAWLLAAAATMIAVKWFKSRFTNSDAALGLYIAFVAVFGLTVVVNEIFYIQKWWKRRDTIAVTSDADVPSVNGKAHIVLSPSFQKMNGVQLLAFCFFVVVAIGTCVALCCLLGLVDDQDSNIYRTP